MESCDDVYEDIKEEYLSHANPAYVSTQTGEKPTKNQGKKTTKRYLLGLVVVLLMANVVLSCVALILAFLEISVLKSESELSRKTLEVIAKFKQAGIFPFYPLPSCSSLPPSSPPGNYWVEAPNGSAVQLYCGQCGVSSQGWRRVAYLDMTNSSQLCPSNLTLLSVANVRTCRMSVASGCSAVTFSVKATTYSEVCGKIKAYQVGSPDGFRVSSLASNVIDSSYVDGISLTHGSPRQHIWTFAAAADEVNSDPGCPCVRSDYPASSRTQPPPFVGNDYFCDTGSQNQVNNSLFYNSDPLWDGAGCGPLNSCCSLNDPPWFYKQLPEPTTDDIEMRLCSDQNNNDDSPIQIAEIYIK